MTAIYLPAEAERFYFDLVSIFDSRIWDALYLIHAWLMYRYRYMSIIVNSSMWTVNIALYVWFFFFQLRFCISFCLLSPYWMLCSRFFPSFNHNQIKTLNNDYTITYSSVIYHHVCSVVLCCTTCMHYKWVTEYPKINHESHFDVKLITNCPAKFWAVWRNKNKKARTQIINKCHKYSFIKLENVPLLSTFIVYR